MSDVEGKLVKLNAVGEEGKDVVVENDFSIHVEYENYYLHYEDALDNEPVFIIKQPSLDIDEYDENGIEEAYFPNMGLYSAGNGLFQFVKIGTPNLIDGTSEIDIKFDEFLGYLYDNSGDLASQLWASAASQNDNMKDLLEFDKKRVVVRDEPGLKAGYFTTNRFGATNYNLVIITCNHVYFAKNCRFVDGWDEDAVPDNEAFLKRLLESVKIVNTGKIEKSKPQNSKFVLPTYEKGLRISFDNFSVAIPDGFVYVTENHIPDGDELANVLTSEYMLVAADKDCVGGLRKFKDASLGINIADQGSSSMNPVFWEHIDEALDGKINMTIGDSNVKFIKGGDGYIIGYGKGNECQSKDDPYWAVYYVVIMFKTRQYMCNLYFNSKKTTAKNYKQTLEDFCNGIEVGGGKKKKLSSKNSSAANKKSESVIEESGLDKAIVSGLKLDAENIYSCFSMIGEKLKAKEFTISEHDNKEDDEDELDDDLDVDVVTDYIYSIEGVNYQNVSYRYATFRNDFELIYNPTYVRPVDMTEWIFPFDYYIVVTLLDNNGEFDPNLLARRLVEKIEELDKDKIYKKLVESAKEAISDGKELESTLSLDYTNKQLSELGNKFEVQGTQYEGRNDRIEKIKVGDKLKLFREPDNEHDRNAIELKNSSGSIGHLPWNAANLLSPAIDAGAISAEAEVVEVTPLSKRSGRAKKALLFVKILVNEQKTRITKSTVTPKVISAEDKSDDNNKTIEVSDKIVTRKEKYDITNSGRKEKEKEKNSEEKKRVFDSEAEREARSFRKAYKELERVWRNRLDDHQRRISTRVFMSPYEVNASMREIIQDRDEYGKKYDDLINKADKKGKELIDKGCSSKGVKSIRDIIEEIVDESNALDIDFGTQGTATMDLGRQKFSVSYSSKRIVRWWNDKYNNIPDVKYEAALKAMELASKDQDYNQAAILFQDLGDYKDSRGKYTQCKEKELDIKYNTALKKYQQGSFSEAIGIFEELGDYRDSKNKIEESKKEALAVKYQEARNAMGTCRNEDGFKQVSTMFKSLGDYLDSVEKADECLILAENAKKDALYSDALSSFTSSDITTIEIAKGKFEKIKDWKDSSHKIEECDEKIEQIRKDILSAKKKRKLKVAFSIFAVIFVIAAVVIIISVIKKNKYDSAMKAFNSGNYAEAKRLFGELSEYNDSELYYFKSEVASAKKGDVITFGTFEQDNDESNGKEPIEWTVIDVAEDKVLIISNYVLIGQNMSEWRECPSWSNCGVRNWLKNSFVSSAFSSDDEKIILETEINNENGEDTVDKAFILSKDEMEMYFPNKQDRIVDATAWAKANGKGMLNMCYSKGDPRHSYWWLRSQIYTTFPYEGYEFESVDYAGETDEYGESGDLGIGVRPVMWIKKYQ